MSTWRSRRATSRLAPHQGQADYRFCTGRDGPAESLSAPAERIAHLGDGREQGIG